MDAMKRTIILLLLITLITSCKERRSEQKTTSAPLTEDIPEGTVLIARDIVTDVIIRPDPDGDPWEIEKVAGYNGEAMVNGIFERVYDGTLTVYDYHSGEVLTANDAVSYTHLTLPTNREV